MNVLVKETIWREYTVAEGISQEDIIEKIKEEGINMAYFDRLLEEENSHNLDTNYAIDIDFEQEGFSTIELRDTQGNIIWENGKS